MAAQIFSKGADGVSTVTLNAALPSAAAGLSGAVASEGTQTPRSAALGLAMDTGRKGIAEEQEESAELAAAE